MHCCLTLPAALSELPALISGDLATVPSSGLGTNAGVADPSKRKIPRAVFFGGGFSDDEYEAVVRAVRAAQEEKTAAATSPDNNTTTTGREENGGEGEGGKEGGGGGGGKGKARSKEQQQQQVVFVKVQKRDVFAAGGLGPNPDIIARVFRRKMAAAMGAAAN